MRKKTSSGNKDILTQMSLVLFNAMALHESLSAASVLEKSLDENVRDSSSLKIGLKKSFVEANNINFEVVFDYGIRILEVLPSNPITESILKRI
ncbi:MAG: hypothetical protein ACTSPV_06435 [Candidatus Hodarchaeales archaeon]